MKRFIPILLLLFAICPAKAQSLQDVEQLYHDYQFEEIITLYEKEIATLTKKKKQAEADSIQQLIPAIERANRMLSNCEDIQIIDSVVMDKAHFLNAYRMSSEAGSLEIHDSTLYYINQLRDKRYFAQKGEDQASRLFSEIRLQNEWSDRKVLNLPYDSLASDDYPFVMPDGVTLYYASTGHGSLGGYDLFVSRYNYNNDNYFAPSQLGMPFNSPANDYLLVIDEINNIGYFATDRFQPKDTVIIYTYIPNESIIPIDEEDRETRMNRAKITSIRDSWKQSDYDDYLSEVKSYIMTEQLKSRREFVFPINDNIVYYTIDDFESSDARKSFLLWQDLTTKIETLDRDLDQQRKAYPRVNAQKREALKREILQAEVRLAGLKSQRDEAGMNARNLEIRYLRTITFN